MATTGLDTELIDITSLIDDCASQLTVREPFVCHRASFNLHDSMAATELMDRKMDCCEIPAENYGGNPGDVLFPRPAPEGLDDPFAPLPWNDLTLSDTVYIGTELLVRLQAFLSGAYVGESVFTCLYAQNNVLSDMRYRLFGDRPLTEPIEDPVEGRLAQFVLFTFALAVVEVTDIARGIILNADIYEEEDFAPTTYDIPFYPNGSEEIALLQIVEKAMKMAASQIKEDGVDRPVIEILLLILGFLFGFISVCTTMGKITSNSLQTDLQSIQDIARLTKLRLSQLDAALVQLRHFDNDDRWEQLRRQSCDPFVNRPLVGNTPVRKPLFRHLKESLRILQVIVDELDWGLCALLLNGSSLERIRRILSRIQRGNVNILCRSSIILNLYFEDKMLGQHDLHALITENVQEWSDAPDSLFEMEQAKSFVDRLAKPIYDTLKLCLLNPCRHLAYLESVSFNDWVGLTKDARLLDAFHKRQCNMDAETPLFFSQFTLATLMRLMDRHLTVGFELGIFYGHHDCAVAFWYRDYLLSGLLNNLAALRKKKDAAKLARSKEKSKNKKGNKVKKSQHLQWAREEEDVLAMMLISVKRDLCRGLKRFIAALRKRGILKDDDFDFTSRGRIFEERFAVFSTIPHPTPLTYDDYVQGSNISDVSDLELIESAGKCFQTAKATVEQCLKESSSVNPDYSPFGEGEVRNLLKICVGNSVYLAKLASLVNSRATTSCEVVLEFEKHAEFCTIKLIDA